jgi:hypothetical protein
LDPAIADDLVYHVVLAVTGAKPVYNGLEEGMVQAEAAQFLSSERRE